MTITDHATAILATLGELQGDQNKRQSLDAQESPSVATLLQQSRDAHTKYRRSIPHMAAPRPGLQPVKIEGNPVAAAAAFREGARLRAEAELADPDHADAAWADDLSQKFPHAALLEWYQEQLSGT